MKQHSSKYAPRRAIVICRAALRRGNLELHFFGNCIGWRFGRRIFAPKTVLALIAAGEAERIGDIVRAIT